MQPAAWFAVIARDAPVVGGGAAGHDRRWLSFRLILWAPGLRGDRQVSVYVAGRARRRGIAATCWARPRRPRRSWACARSSVHLRPQCAELELFAKSRYEQWAGCRARRLDGVERDLVIVVGASPAPQGVRLEKSRLRPSATACSPSSSPSWFWSLGSAAADPRRLLPLWPKILSYAMSFVFHRHLLEQPHHCAVSSG